MAFIPVGASRVPFSLNQLLTQDAILLRQQALTAANQELSSGRRISLPSDDPSGAVQVAILQAVRERNEKYLDNVRFGSSALSTTEQYLQAASDAIDRGKQIGLRNNSTLLTQGEREGDLRQVDSIIDNLLITANQKYLNRYVFAGQRVAGTPFVRDAGYIRFNGDNGRLATLDGQETTFDLNVTPNSSIGTDSAAGRGIVDFNPDLLSGTRLAELNGGRGIARGVIEISVGGPAISVDLSGADTIQDVLDAIDTAVGAPGTATISPSGNGIRITGGGPITVRDRIGGSTALDLGLRAVSAASPLDGGDLDPVVAKTTPIAALNLAAPLGVLQIDNGPYSASIDLSAATTVEEVLNAINGAGVRVRAEINAARTGIDVVNVLAGSGFTITGATAQTLGVATTSVETPLADFNDGAGVGTGDGADLVITTRDGTQYQIDLNDSSPPCGGVGTSVGSFLAFLSCRTGGNVTGDVAPSGAIRLFDNTGASAVNFSVQSGAYSPTASDLGIDTGPAGVAASTFTGVNKHTARVKGTFDTLIRLRNGLATGDLREIQLATRQLETDAARTLGASAALGARLQLLDQTADRLSTEITQNRSDAARVLEPDLAETITNLLSQQNALQATLSATGRLLQQSLLDFL